MKKLIALTFDDGPCEYTPRILNTLAQYNARAGFFVVGSKAEGGKEIIKRAYDAGHEIISHTWSHCKEPYLGELSPEEIRAELLDTNAAIQAITGFSPKMFRPPYGHVSQTLKDVAEELGLSIILWSLDAWDWESKNADAVYNEIFSNLHDNAVILCHDVHATTADAMERVIPALSEKYELVTVSELMRSQGMDAGARVIFPPGETKY